MKRLSEYVKVAEAAEILGVSQGTVRAWAEAGKFQCTKIQQTDTACSRERSWSNSLTTSTSRRRQRTQNDAISGLSMVKLEDLKSGLPLVGLEPSSIATVAAVVTIGEGSVQVFYRTSDGQTKERLLGRADEENLSIAIVERPWSFDGDEVFQLTCEAKRIDLAFLFDPMMAVHTSNVDPLPHQITAVYESMLPRQPLRFVLADDPGAGRTHHGWPLHS